MIKTNAKFIAVLNQFLSQIRISHCERVCAIALDLSSKYSADSDVVFKASLFHDIAKNQTPETMTELGVNLTEAERLSWDTFPAVWHALVGPKLMNHQLGFNNPAVDEAIRSHTTGLPDMSIESKILFVADFIEPGRDFHFRDKLESVAFNDINKAVALIALLNIHKLTKLCKEIHPNSVLCWNHYCHYVMSEDLKALGDPIV